jgi:N-sulfoglucosamine sulfohydrolase
MNKEPLNIVVVICHDLGQHLGCYGQPDVRSPNIDAFAASGIRFENSFCTAPQCSPSRAALWTGRYPHANGVVGLTHSGFANDLNADEMHLAQILRASGYDTHLFGHAHEARTPERCGHEHNHGNGPCAKIAADFAEMISARRSEDRPFFAQVNFFEPHRPFPHNDVETLSPVGLTVPPYLPDIPEVQDDLADIEASIASADKAFGAIVDAVRSSETADSTLIVFTADHGIAFPHAKMTLYDPGIEVALIMAGPGIVPGRVYDELISNVEVMPTLLELAELPLPSNLHGRSFAGLLAGKPYVPNERVFAEKTYHTYYDPMRAVRTDRWKLIANFEFAPWQETPPDYRNNAKSYVEISNALDVPYDVQYHPPFELYDLTCNRWEQRNLADDARFTSIRDELIQALLNWMEKTGDPLLDGPMAQGAYTQRMEQFRIIGQQSSEGDGPRPAL